MLKGVFSRRSGLVSLFAAGMAVAAWAAEHEVIEFSAPSTLYAGTNASTTVQVNQVPMSVTFTSSPSGAVNYTTTITSTSQSVSLPISAFASGGSYTITAAPTGGGTSKSRSVQVVGEDPCGSCGVHSSGNQ